MHPMPARSSPNVATTRVHPSDLPRGVGGGGDDHRAGGGRAAAADRPAAVYTVWKRSSMGFQGTDGFCVYDAAGSLAFRVDNYSRRRKLFAGELVLMDGHGAPLLALRPQILSMRDQWNCYRASSEESGGGDNSKGGRRQHLFSMRRCSLVQRGNGDEAEVHMCSTAPSSPTDGNSFQQYQQQRREEGPSFRVQGSFWRRSCKIRRGDGGEEVARITRKKAGATAAAAQEAQAVPLGDDVFSLTVMPDADCAMIMAFVVIMDRICQKPYTPLMCST